MTPEEIARQNIDKLLAEAGWKVQDRSEMNLGAGPGVAVREWPFASGPADYLLFVGRRPVGVVEAKPEGATLSGVAVQSDKYLTSAPLGVPNVNAPLPFGYESTGVETFFRDLRDPDARSRRVWTFQRPEGLRELAARAETLRARLARMPPLIAEGLRDCQIEAITELEKSLAANRPRALIQMTMGSGKTYAAVSFIYRLIKHAGAKRVLFLVDRRSLGRQTAREFEQYVAPDDGRKFTELYNVQHLGSNTIDRSSRVCITTIQRMYSMLRGEAEFDAANEEVSLEEVAPQSSEPLQVAYNPAVPVETFDFIVTDECHRSIYNLWRQVLEYFDAFIIGLTATPSKQTLGFFNQNLVTEYSHERAVADGVNVGYEVYRIKTKISERGGGVEAGFYVDRRDRLTRRRRWEKLDDDLDYTARELDRSVVAEDQIRTVVRTFKERLFTELFPGRTVVPKTLIFAKDDSHAEDIVHVVREVFGKGNDFCKKITYRTTGEKPEDLIQSFRNSFDPRIAVTVDMISTGTDIRPLECLVFMRDVKSQVYFEQMKGRGTRTISDTELQVASGEEARSKTHFVIVDAVGVCETDKTDSRPLERKRSVPFNKLIESVMLGVRDEDTLSSLAGRLARLERSLDEAERREIEEASGGPTLRGLTARLFEAIDVDRQVARAREMFGAGEPTGEQVGQAAAELAERACAPFDDPALRNKIIEVQRRSEQTIDTVSKDEVEFAGYDGAAKERARTVVDTFRRFIEENRDELTALQIIYNQPYGRRRLTYEAIEQLAHAVGRPPYSLAPEAVWSAYEQLERSKVRGAGPQRMLTNLVSLVRFAIGEADELEPWAETVNRRFDEWLGRQGRGGRTFTGEQTEWLLMIRDHIATSLVMEAEAFELAPFYEKGGAFKVYQLFGPELTTILDELNEALAA
jgi:type I restriction enzyme, R subunit